MAAERGEGEVEEPETEFFPLLEQGVTSEAKEVVADYAAGVLALDGKPSASCIAVAEIDGRFLCAFPEAAWNRIKRRRVLGEEFLAKAVAVHVPSCAVDGRDVPERDFNIKAWLGLISAEHAQLVGYSPDLVADLAFPIDSNGILKLPYARVWWRDHFTFLSMSEPTGGPAVEGRPTWRTEDCRTPWTRL